MRNFDAPQHSAPSHSDGVKAHQVIAELVSRAGGSARVARAMGKPTFQGTLHKYCAGHVPHPSRQTAERIARHFKIPVDAVYDDRVAATVAEQLQVPPPPPGLSDQPQIEAPMHLQEPDGLVSLRALPALPSVQPDADLDQLLDRMGIALAALPEGLRAAVGALLERWATAGGDDRYRHALISLMAPAAQRRKPPRAA